MTDTTIALSELAEKGGHMQISSAIRCSTLCSDSWKWTSRRFARQLTASAATNVSTAATVIETVATKPGPVRST